MNGGKVGWVGREGERVRERGRKVKMKGGREGEGDGQSRYILESRREGIIDVNSYGQEKRHLFM